MIHDLVSDWRKKMTDTEQYHAQAIDLLEKRIAKLENKHRVVSQQNEMLMEMLSKMIRGKNE